MTVVEIGALASLPGIVLGWLAHYFTSRRSAAAAVESDPVLALVRAELEAFGDRVCKDVTNAVTIALLEAELRRRGAAP